MLFRMLVLSFFPIISNCLYIKTWNDLIYKFSTTLSELIKLNDVCTDIRSEIYNITESYDKICYEYTFYVKIYKKHLKENTNKCRRIKLEDFHEIIAKTLEKLHYLNFLLNKLDLKAKKHMKRAILIQNELFELIRYLYTGDLDVYNNEKISNIIKGFDFMGDFKKNECIYIYVFKLYFFVRCLIENLKEINSFFTIILADFANEIYKTKRIELEIAKK
ncbi:hypothetical protein EDEG_03418, partial [Edhazardia aedis USNM 41457]